MSKIFVQITNAVAALQSAGSSGGDDAKKTMRKFQKGDPAQTDKDIEMILDVFGSLATALTLDQLPYPRCAEDTALGKRMVLWDAREAGRLFKVTARAGRTARRL